jgi:hypothetical protein
VQEELELEAGSRLKQELLVTPPSKRSKPNVSTIFKDAFSDIRIHPDQAHLDYKKISFSLLAKLD